MAVNEAAIADFAKRFQLVTGKTPNRFVCPITLQDDPVAELCNGHILCDKLKSAGKLTTVQRADVDNRFGTFVERDFVKLANFRNAKTEDILREEKRITITGPSGERMPAFFAGNEARVRFQQLELYDDNGKTFATPYLESHKLDAGQYKQLQIEWMFFIHKYCFTAAMLKSAYLNLFRLLDYSWVLDTSGDKVRRTLAASHEAPDRQSALDQFADFEGCCWIAGNDAGENNLDSLGDNRLLFHFTEGNAQSGLLFGVSCLFWINGVMMAVTLPMCNRPGHFFVSWKYYQEFIREHELCHNIHLAHVVNDVIHIDPKAMTFQIVDKMPPNNSVARILSPCHATLTK